MKTILLHMKQNICLFLAGIFVQKVSMLLIKGILNSESDDEVMCKMITMGWNSGYTKNKIQNLFFYNKLS